MNSRNKGNKNERKVAKLMEKWTGKKFSRTPSSGGLNWKKANVKGDIVCSEEGHWFPFCVEVKAHREINFEHLLYLDKPKVLEFWEQCAGDAEKANKEPILFMRYDRLPKDFFFVVVRANFISIAQAKESLTLKRGDLELTIITSTQFFSYNYKRVKKHLKSIYRK